MKKYKHKSTFTVLLMLILVLFVSIFAGCQSSGMAETGGDWSLDPISDDLKLKVENAVNAYLGPEAKWTWGGYEFYGACGDRVILFNRVPVSITTTLEVAGSTIYCSSGLETYVYANGKIYSLKEAYEKGLLSEENIADIAEYNNKRYKQIIDAATHE